MKISQDKQEDKELLIWRHSCESCCYANMIEKKREKKKFRERTNQISDGNRIGTNDETTPLDEGEPHTNQIKIHFPCNFLTSERRRRRMEMNREERGVLTFSSSTFVLNYTSRVM